MGFVGVAEGGVGAFGGLTSVEHPVGFDGVVLAVDPLRLDRVALGALDR